MQSDCIDLGQPITIYRLKLVDGEILIEETGAVICVNVRKYKISNHTHIFILIHPNTMVQSKITT
jgi:hypothetical protein